MFFQQYWNIVEKDVMSSCLNILNDGGEMDKINTSNIILIPKTSHPKNMVNFQPISLCSVVYKMIVKIVANRLQKVLDLCIDKA